MLPAASIAVLRVVLLEILLYSTLKQHPGTNTWPKSTSYSYTGGESLVTTSRSVDLSLYRACYGLHCCPPVPSILMKGKARKGNYFRVNFRLLRLPLPAPPPASAPAPISPETVSIFFFRAGLQEALYSILILLLALPRFSHLRQGVVQPATPHRCVHGEKGGGRGWDGREAKGREEGHDGTVLSSSTKHTQVRYLRERTRCVGLLKVFVCIIIFRVGSLHTPPAAVPYFGRYLSPTTTRARAQKCRCCALTRHTQNTEYPASHPRTHTSRDKHKHANELDTPGL